MARHKSSTPPTLCLTFLVFLPPSSTCAGMFERESKREKNLEKRAAEVSRRAKAMEAEEKRGDSHMPDGKDEKMEEILRKVWRARG